MLSIYLRLRYPFIKKRKYSFSYLGRLSPHDFYQFYFGEFIEKENCPILVISISPLKTHLLIGLENGQMLIVFIDELMTAIKVNNKG